MLRTMCVRMRLTKSILGQVQAQGRQATRKISTSCNSFNRRALPVVNDRIKGYPLYSSKRLVAASATDDKPVPTSYAYGPKEILYEPEKLTAVNVSPSLPLEWKGDLLVIGVFEEALETKDDKTVITSADLKKLDEGLGGAISDILETADFKAKPGSSQKTRAGTNAKFVALVGLGPVAKATPTSDWGASVWQSLGHATAAAAKGSKIKTIAVVVADADQVPADHKIPTVAKVVNGFINANSYEPTRFKSKTPSEIPEVLDILCPGITDASKEQQAIAEASALAKGALFTRYLVEAPPNVCTPTYLADAAKHIASIAPERFDLKILEKEDCEKLGMGCFLGVSEASEEPPKLIHLKYSKGNAKKKVAIVGKGLTFDSGGYNLKPSAGGLIELMKFDMGGGGATLGAARAFAELQPDNTEVHFIVASCENMVDGKGLRPGDILVASNGKTVEINNTDAEGRLALCDALIYAQKEGAESIVDVATLTGACIVALGTDMAGMYANNDDMATGLQNASKATGEKIWRMPLEDGYLEQMKSTIADYKNSGGRWGGSITAALFLKEFIDSEKVSWAHLDIAGPVWDDKKGGATGYGAQLLAEWAANEGK